MRPQHKATDKRRDEVVRLSAIGMTQERVAGVMGVTVKTLMKHYKDEYEQGNDRMVNELVSVSMEVALDPDHKDSRHDRHFLLERKGGFIRKQELDAKLGIMNPELAEWLGDA